ncbi:MAG: hypothetical protein ACFFBP_11535 [Promethearchaeota archaeon]
MISSDDLSVKIVVRCPICNTKGQMNIEKNIIDQNTKGITAINVAENLICEHSFVTYVDKNLVIRDSFVCDFKVEIPEIEDPELERFEAPNLFDISIIKLNLMPSVLAKLIKAILLGEKIVYISDQEHLNEHYLKFLQYIFGDTFNIEIIFLPLREYKRSSKDYREYFVLNGNNILRDNNKIIEQAKLKIENSIVQKFFRDYDDISSLILFKNEINKIERIIHQILKYHKSQKEGQEFRTPEAISYLNNIYKINIPLSYFNFLLDIIESYFVLDLNRPSKMTDFLGLL